jgi:hypothetical protein
MKHIKLYEGFADKINESDENQISEQEVNYFLDNSVNVNVSLTDLLSDAHIILLMKNGEV